MIEYIKEIVENAKTNMSSFNYEVSPAELEGAALEVFCMLTEYEFKTLGDQKRFCREVARWHFDKTAEEES